ncbi:hypothetical protein HDU86_003537 [Geranomyces michiganensis]|nr:hypothetical protein HDU86_003537 [Geranomyces michiganensis]
MAAHRGRNSNTQQLQSTSPDLLGFGYACRLFRDDELAARLETGRHLLPWRHTGLSGHDDAPLMIDRYDVRNLLDSLSDFDQSAQEDEADGIIKADGVCDNDEDQNDNGDSADWKKVLDAERYQDIDADEEAFLAMNDAEQAAFLADKRRETPRTEDGFNAQRWEYINAPPPPPEEDPTPPPNPFVLKYPAPPGIAPPHSERLAVIIEKTAKFINASDNPQMEFLVKAKQSGNPDFRFLDADSVLNAYYKHVRKLVGTALGGLDAYGSDSDSDDGGGDDDADADDAGAGLAKAEEHPSEQPSTDSAARVPSPLHAASTPAAAPPPPPPQWAPPPLFPPPQAPPSPLAPDQTSSYLPPADLRAVIDKLALFVARNGADFEAKVKAKNRDDPRFSFLLPWNKWHAYYEQVRDDHLNDPMLNRNAAQVAADEEAERNAKRARARAALEKVRAAALGGGGGSGGSGGGMEPKRRKVDQKP